MLFFSTRLARELGWTAEWFLRPRGKRTIITETQGPLDIVR